MRVAIIGGGISGLSSAYYLARSAMPGLAITLIEKSSSLGGVIGTTRREGCLLEQGPESFLAAKPAAIELVKDLGLGGDLISSNDAKRKTYILRNGRLVPLPDGLMMMIPTRPKAVLASPLLSWRAKLRMAIEYFRRPGPVAPEDRSAEDFIVDHFGRETLDYLAEPLLAGVYGGDPAQLSAASILPRFAELEARYGSLSRGALAALKKASPSSGSIFRTLKNGLGSLVSTLEESLRESVRFVRGNAEAVTPSDGVFNVRIDGAPAQFDRVILACPAPDAARLLQAVNGELSELLASIPYNSAMTLAFVYDRAACPVTGFGFLVPRREREALLACTYVHNKFDYRAPVGTAVLRCFLSGDSLSLGDEQVVDAARRDLSRILGLEAVPRFFHLTRLPQSMPQYTLGHAERLRRIDEILEKIPGLSLAGNAYRGIGIPDCVASARAAANRITSARTPTVLPA